MTLPASIAAILDRGEWRYIKQKPHPKQLAVLLAPETEVFYGGAAAGGKSSAHLMRALLYVDVPGYTAVLFRRTYPELYGAGGLITRAKEWLAGTDASWNEQQKRFTFPSGATLDFRYCERNDDVYAYQGQEFAFMGFDEITAWPDPWPYLYLRSRLRRPKALQVPLGILVTANPGGPGHGWAKQRFIDPRPDLPDLRTIRAAVRDNPAVDAGEYETTLSHLPPVLRRQLMDGDWSVVEEGALIGRENLPVFEVGPPRDIQRVRFWDCAATKEAGCYTVGVRGAKDTTGVVWVESVVRGQWAAGEVDEVIKSTAYADGRGVAVDWEEEPGSAGIAVSASRKKVLAGFWTFGTKATGPKWVRAQPFASYARAGNVRLVAGPWNGAYLDELTTATPELDGYMDQVDATSGMFAWLTTHGRGGAPAVAATPSRVESEVSDLLTGGVRRLDWS